MPGAQGPKTVKGAHSIKSVIRLCTGISQNHHPCLLTLPFRTGRYLLFRNLFLIFYGSGHAVTSSARSECLRGGKNYSYATAPGLGAARPPELCGLRIRPRTDVDPPRSAGAYRLAAR